MSHPPPCLLPNYSLPPPPPPSLCHNTPLPLPPNHQSHLYPYVLLNIQLGTSMSQFLFTHKLVTLHLSIFFLLFISFFSCSFKSSISFVCPTPLSSCSQFTLSSILPKVDILYNYTTLVSTLLYPLRPNWISYLTLLTLSNC